MTAAEEAARAGIDLSLIDFVIVNRYERAGAAAELDCLFASAAAHVGLPL